MTALPNDYDSDPGRFLSAGKHPHDDVHPYVAAQTCGSRLPRLKSIHALPFEFLALAAAPETRRPIPYSKSARELGGAEGI